MITKDERISRQYRVQAAKFRGIRAVPDRPGPEFRRFLACEQRPKPCVNCRVDCIQTHDEGGI